jgi:hypothetical protein
MRAVRIVVLDDHQRAARDFFPLDQLRTVCDPELIVHMDHVDTEDELVERVGQAEVVLARSTTMEILSARTVVEGGTRIRYVDSRIVND